MMMRQSEERSGEETGPDPDLPVTPLQRTGERPGERVQRWPDDALAGLPAGRQARLTGV